MQPNEPADALGYPVSEAMEDAHRWIDGVCMYAGLRGWRPALAVLAAEVARLQVERGRLLDLCTNAHDRLLRGDSDAELLAMLESAWNPEASDA